MTQKRSERAEGCVRVGNKEEAWAVSSGKKKGKVRGRERQRERQTDRQTERERQRPNDRKRTRMGGYRESRLFCE